MRILIFLLGAMLGASLMLFIVLMQWNAPEKLGWSISWLPLATPQDLTAGGSIRAMPPVSAPVSDSYPEPQLADIVAEPTPMPWPPFAPPTTIPATAETTVSSSLLMPVAEVKANQLSDTFNDARGGGRIHDAIDIMAPKGTAVFAVNDGKVVKLFNSKLGGLTVYQFDPNETHAYYYAHLDGYASSIKEGATVKRGEVIGYVGSTGNASPEAPHLHFAVFVLGAEKKWWQGTPINPYPLLGGAVRK
jgi:murein DD-endopeptidase MepM/ murein hydrolase activator NlpD